MRKGSWAEGCQQGWWYVDGAAGQSPDPGSSICPGGVWHLCSIQSLHVLINGHDFRKFQWCRLSQTAIPGECGGHQAGWTGHWGPQGPISPEPSMAGSALCIGSTLPPSHSTSICTFSPHPSDTLAGLQLQRGQSEELLGCERIFWNWPFIFYLTNRALNLTTGMGGRAGPEAPMPWHPPLVSHVSPPL